MLTNSCLAAVSTLSSLDGSLGVWDDFPPGAGALILEVAT